MSFDFDAPLDRRGTHCSKWDSLETLFGANPDTALAMWVADMDLPSPPAVARTLHEIADHGVFGYFGDPSRYLAAIQGWMRDRHGWAVEAEHILTCHGLVQGTALCINSFTRPGDGVILFTPVYHAFHRVIRAAGREIVESPLIREAGRYRMDLESLAAALTGTERMVVFCSPHNPGGTVWTVEDQRALAEFCAAHDLILVSDEIHFDLLMPGQSHVPMALAAPDIADRLVMMTAASKTFNLAAGLTGNLIVADDHLRSRLKAEIAAYGIGINAIGARMSTAAYEEGAAWLDALLPYLDDNRRRFEAGMAAIPGVSPMPLEATYLTWIDFAGTGMSSEDVRQRVEGTAQVIGNRGPTFGTGGETWLRFNIATRRAVVEEAVERLQGAFADLQ